MLCSLLTCTCLLSWFCFKDIVTFKNEEERERAVCFVHCKHVLVFCPGFVLKIL